MWKSKLRKVYANLEEFKAYCEIYNLHTRLGYKTPENAWRYNPMIQGSTNPSDYKKVDCLTFHFRPVIIVVNNKRGTNNER